MRRRPLAFAAALLLPLAAGARAQEPPAPAGPPPLRVSSAVAPETVTVGDRFRSVLQVVAPPGATVEFSPLPVADSLQPADSLRVIPARAGEPPIAAYSLVAWVAGAPLHAQAPVRVAFADGTAATYLVPLRLPVVASVLPADTAGVEPRPARGVLPPGGEPRPWWPWALLAALLAALGAGAWLAWRRRGPAPARAAALTPRERALAALERIAAEGPDSGALYPAATRVLRRYLEEVDPGWSADLTSRELVERLRADGLLDEPREALRGLLQHADRVKFARYSPGGDEVGRFLAAARAWIAAHPPARASEPEEREAA